MADPFQNVDAAGDAFIKMFADAMDARQSDPTMEKIVGAYLAPLKLTKECIIVEVGAGAGAVSRRIATHAHPAQVIGFEPSKGFVDEARLRASTHDNLRFEVADGTQLPCDDATIDVVIMHTVLSHVTNPDALVAEATRILKEDGILVICDADFSKAALGHFPNDPLDACAKAFVHGFVTDPFIVGKMRDLMGGSGLTVTSFDVVSRVISDTNQMRPWVEVTTKEMVERGDISQPFADALLAEHDRRVESGALYGYQVFATAMGQKRT